MVAMQRQLLGKGTSRDERRRELSWRIRGIERLEDRRLLAGDSLSLDFNSQTDDLVFLSVDDQLDGGDTLIGSAAVPAASDPLETSLGRY